MTNSITTRLIVLLSVSSAVILSLGMAIDYRFSRDEILARLQAESVQTIQGAVTDLENSLDSVEGAALFFARVLEQRDYSRAGLERLLRDIVAQNEDVYGATIALNPEGLPETGGFAPYYYQKNNAMIRTDLTVGEDRYWQRPWYSDAVAAGRPVWVEPYFDSGGGEILMTTFSVPVYRRDEGDKRFLYGVITADVTLDELHQYLQRLRLGRTGYGILLSRKGIILSTNNPKNIMQHLLDTVGDPANVAVWRELFRGALAGEVSSRQIQCPGTPGVCRARLSALQSTGWPVGVIYSEDEILAPLRAYQQKAIGLGLLTVLGIALVVTLISRRLTQPLKALALVTDQIALGRFDVPLPRIQGRDEVARLIGAFASMKENLKSYVSNLESATASRSRLEGELAAAREIQMAMLPQDGEALEQADVYDLWAKVRPAKSVGGDLYTFYRDDVHRLFICVGDVSDKGVPAALFMAKTLSHIQQFSEAFVEPATGLALLNDALESGNSNCMFVTVFFGVLDLTTLEMRFASAGHTAPRLLRAGASRPLLQERGPALGLSTNLTFPENVIQLKAGDRLAIYSDGIDEAFNDCDQMYGTARLDRVLERTGNRPVTEAGIRIFESIEEFAGSTPQSDDITLMLVDLLEGR